MRDVLALFVLIVLAVAVDRPENVGRYAAQVRAGYAAEIARVANQIDAPESR